MSVWGDMEGMSDDHWMERAEQIVGERDERSSDALEVERLSCLLAASEAEVERLREENVRLREENVRLRDAVRTAYAAATDSRDHLRSVLDG